MIPTDMTSHWMQTMGWTLLHTLWQAPLLLLFLNLFLRAVPRDSKLRYAAATATMVLLLASAMATFMMVMPQNDGVVEISTQRFDNASDMSATISSAALPYLDQAIAWLNQHMAGIMRLWLIGALFFLARIAAGFYFIDRIRRNAIPVSEYWTQRLQEIAVTINLHRAIQFAEAHIDVPVVVGFAKPMILFPTGLMAGLSVAQVEAILIHELSHIKRYDFIVNIFQSIMESLFFFNPFAWMISAKMREEREHCCDDMVLATGAAPLLYAQTLAQLEEARVSVPLGLALAGDKNQLLQRIKRIMEKSITKNPGRGRLLPIALLVLGLACMSWLTIQNSAPEKETEEPDQATLAADTTVKEKSKQKTKIVGRKTVTTWDKDGVPHEEIVETYEGEMDTPETWDVEDWDMTDFDMPEMPGFPAVPDHPGFATVPDFPDFPDVPPVGEFGFYDFHLDSVPYHPFSDEEWRAFEKDFKNKFKDQFKDFWEKNQVQIEKLMDEARQNSGRFDEMKIDGDFAREMAMMSEKIAALGDMERFAIDMKLQGEAMKNFDVEMQKMEFDAKKMEHDMKLMEGDLKELERKTEAFEKEFQQELVKDGYLKKGDVLKDIRLTDDDITVNGQKIKEADLPKYRAIRKKHFHKGDQYFRIE